jgi:hypothetical protein
LSILLAALCEKGTRLRLLYMPRARQAKDIVVVDRGKFGAPPGREIPLRDDSCGDDGRLSGPFAAHSFGFRGGKNDVSAL